MDNKNTGGPAFPTDTAFQGMSLRDYFAAKTMSGLFANMGSEIFPEHISHVAVVSYAMADAMLNARQK